MTDPRTSLVAAGYDAMIDTWEDRAVREPEGDATFDWIRGHA